VRGEVDLLPLFVIVNILEPLVSIGVREHVRSWGPFVNLLRKSEIALGIGGQELLSLIAIGKLPLLPAAVDDGVVMCLVSVVRTTRDVRGEVDLLPLFVIVNILEPLVSIGVREHVRSWGPFVNLLRKSEIALGIGGQELLSLIARGKLPLPLLLRLSEALQGFA